MNADQFFRQDYRMAESMKTHLILSKTPFILNFR